LALLSCLGAISGTSMDGIDVAWIETDGEGHVRPRAGATLPYPPALRARLGEFLKDPARAETDPLTALEAEVTQAFGDAILAFMEAQGIHAGALDLIGLHGQTVWHRPERRFTRQLGSGAALARRLGASVVDGFRLADVAAGGQGAPLVPLYHAALANGLERPVMVLNLGGVANVTWIDGETIIAFDTGPASALMDDLVLRRFGLPFDEGGRIAASGQVDEAILAELMANPFFGQRPPKSLDRNDFHARAKIVETLPDADAVATLAAFTIRATAAALEHVPEKPRRWLVGGGGRLNGHLMRGLAAELGTPVEPVDTLGWNGDALEAECFAYLAARSLKGLPLSLPMTTGVPAPMTGGRLWRVDTERREGLTPSS
jgi:anhydro-N-acetylmuramic acid kinase